MSEPFESLVIQRLDELREDNKLFLTKLEDHGKEDTLRFESIDRKFGDLAAAAAEAKGTAKATAKFWGLCAGLPAPIAGAIFALWKVLHHIQ
jgi:hypothetical protein